MKTLIILILLSLNTYSQEYVTPEELEEGWGFGYNHVFQNLKSQPKNVINNFFLLPNEKRIYVNTRILDSLNFKYLSYNFNIESNEIIKPDWNLRTFCSLNSEYCVFYKDYINLLINGELKYNLCNKECNRINDYNCYIGEKIVKNEKGVFTYLIKNMDSGKNEVYKVDILKLIETNCPEYEYIATTDLKNDYPQNIINKFHFPINSVDFIVEPIYEYNYTSGFKLYKNFQFKKQVTLPKKDTWSFSSMFEFSNDDDFYLGNSYAVGKEGDVYCWVTYRDSTELYEEETPYTSEVAREARDASGIYRIDTNGQNAVQLVRSWSYNPGGLQISGDGETIYYAYILPDSTSAIMKMDRYGKNKEIVFKLDPEILNIEKQILTPKIYPNPASESITISGIENGKAIIYNSIGQKLIEQDITSTSEINISNLQSGMYIVKLENAGKVTFEKLMVGR